MLHCLLLILAKIVRNCVRFALKIFWKQVEHCQAQLWCVHVRRPLIINSRDNWPQSTQLNAGASD